MESLESFEQLFGKVLVEPQQACGFSVPFLFFLRPADRQHLRFSMSNYHSQTWQSDYNVEWLQDMRDDIGIGGSWNDFLAYMRNALSSDNVKLVLGAAPSAAKVVAQMSKGMPRLSLPLNKIDGASAQDAMGAIASELFLSFQTQSLALASERGQVTRLNAALALEKGKSKMIQEQVDASIPGKRKRQRPGQMSIPPSLPDQLSLALIPTETVPPSQTDGVRETASDSKVKTAGVKAKVHVAPASRRAKRRGTAIGEENDT